MSHIKEVMFNDVPLFMSPLCREEDNRCSSQNTKAGLTFYIMRKRNPCYTHVDVNIKLIEKKCQELIKW